MALLHLEVKMRATVVKGVTDSAPGAQEIYARRGVLPVFAERVLFFSLRLPPSGWARCASSFGRGWSSIGAEGRCRGKHRRSRDVLPGPLRRPGSAHQVKKSTDLFKGKSRTRVPVRSKTALARAGMDGGVPGSPAPPIWVIFSKSCTSKTGAVCIRRAS